MKKEKYASYAAETAGNVSPHLMEEKIGPALGFAAKESFNLLRTNVAFSFASGDGAKVIGVSSPSPHEGKSFVATNLAYSFAEAGHKVMLIEGDLRCPSVYKKLGVALAPGLSNLLVGDDTNVIREGVVHENLFVITAGDIPPNPSELLGSDRMKRTLELLKERFDYIVIDLPPILTVSDPLITAKFLDGMVVVVKHESTRRNEVSECVRLLKFTGVHILGFVYNEHGTKGAAHRRHYYSNSYNYYGGYGKKAEKAEKEPEKK